MTVFSGKILSLALVCAGFLVLAPAAHAGILRSTNGMPVLTKDGNCVTTGFDGSAQDCAAAKAAAGLGSAEGTSEGALPRDQSVYFGFNKSDLSPEAMKRLDHLVKKLHAEARHHKGPKGLTIIGFADRIGNAEYNKKLALRRAHAVHAYLVAKGVKLKIAVRSVGKTEPRAECSADLKETQLIHCLRQDRRVDIVFTP